MARKCRAKGCDKEIKSGAYCWYHKKARRATGMYKGKYSSKRGGASHVSIGAGGAGAGSKDRIVADGSFYSAAPVTPSSNEQLKLKLI